MLVIIVHIFQLKDTVKTVYDHPEVNALYMPKGRYGDVHISPARRALGAVKSPAKDTVNDSTGTPDKTLPGSPKDASLSEQVSVF